MSETSKKPFTITFFVEIKKDAVNEAEALELAYNDISEQIKNNTVEFKYRIDNDKLKPEVQEEPIATKPKKWWKK